MHIGKTMKSMVEHDVRFTGRIDYEQTILLVVLSMRYLKVIEFIYRLIHSSPLKKPNAPSMIKLSVGTSIKMVARRLPCLSE